LALLATEFCTRIYLHVTRLAQSRGKVIVSFNAATFPTTPISVRRLSLSVYPAMLTGKLGHKRQQFFATDIVMFFENN
tara:strand:- start:1077 stop:1310 length:234 start_codon:yes stop_codon:yes gene_type:complete